MQARIKAFHFITMASIMVTHIVIRIPMIHLTQLLSSPDFCLYVIESLLYVFSEFRESLIHLPSLSSTDDIAELLAGFAHALIFSAQAF